MARLASASFGRRSEGISSRMMSDRSACGGEGIVYREYERTIPTAVGPVPTGSRSHERYSKVLDE